MPGPSIGKPESLPRISSDAVITPHERVAIGRAQGAGKAPTTAKGRLDRSAGGTGKVASTSDEECFVNLGGLKIRGLDLASLKEGTAKVRMPLNPGSKYVIPYRPKPIELKVHASTVAFLTVQIG